MESVMTVTLSVFGSAVFNEAGLYESFITNWAFWLPVFVVGVAINIFYSAGLQLLAVMRYTP